MSCSAASMPHARSAARSRALDVDAAARAIEARGRQAARPDGDGCGAGDPAGRQRAHGRRPAAGLHRARARPEAVHADAVRRRRRAARRRAAARGRAAARADPALPRRHLGARLRHRRHAARPGAHAERAAGGARAGRPARARWTRRPRRSAALLDRAGRGVHRPTRRARTRHELCRPDAHRRRAAAAGAGRLRPAGHASRHPCRVRGGLSQRLRSACWRMPRCGC